MKAICTSKKTGQTWEARAEKINKQWIIGGDRPEYKTTHYVVISNDKEFTLKNGRLIPA